MTPSSPRVSDDMSSDDRDYSWQNDHPGQESIPLRDHSPNSGTSKRPLNTKRRISGGEGRWDQKDGKPAWAGENHSGGQFMAGELGKHSLGLWLMILYTIIAILSWSITCVLCYKPIGIPSYFDQVGNYSRSQYERSDGLRKAANVGSSIIAAITIPVTSAICAKAAAVYCQRRSDAKAPPLTLRQMLALADKGWSDIAVLRDVLRPSTGRRIRSPLLMLSAVLIGITFLIPVLQGALVSTVHIKVLSMQDLEFTSTVIGQQITPAVLASISNLSVMDNIISTTINGKLTDKQPYLWSTGQSDLNVNSLGASLFNTSSFGILPKELFTASFPVGTDAGVLRNLALRLNVSVDCASVAQSDFPSSCSGANPLNQMFSNVNDSDPTPFGDFDRPRYRARICAPGDILTSPWQYTSDRQDVQEEFWLDYQRTGQAPGAGANAWGIEDGGSNFTQHCYDNSTLGYFELPNYWSGHVVGSLLDKVPHNARNLSYQNGYEDELSGYQPAGSESFGIASPFLTAVVAVFGPNTFFNTLASSSNYTDSNRTDAEQLLCAQLHYPFTGLSVAKNNGQSTWWNQSDSLLQCSSDDPSNYTVSPLLVSLFNWLANFGDAATATAALTFATYAASNAILNVGPGPQDFAISACAGTDLQKPTMPLVAMIVITLLLATQLAGLAFLAIYASLDAWAMLRLGAEIGPDVPAVCALTAQRVGMLDEKKGWVGDAGVGGREGKVECRELVLGGRERVRGGLMYRMVRGSKDGGRGDSEIGGAL